ncbi:5-deoxy-glucuronate isomerase [Inquilinus sp. CAU 1745]|uniref:5-deoxy-glucuronate isomerase n=1 Tax=Inquilinus sp. CAU 1745 TaxID=3140369 RepID=UPI00325A7F93
MTDLLVKPTAPDADGSVLKVTPESAGWDYVGFEVLKPEAGGRIERAMPGREVCIVPVTGTIDVTVDDGSSGGDRLFGKVGGRTSPFDGKPQAVYVPAGAAFAIEAVTAAEIAICSAPGKGGHAARLIGPDDVGFEERGTGTNRRLIHNILPETAPAESLLVVEVVTPGGNWSSYPPHKHDRDAPPEETKLEETYYHRLSPPQGFAFQRVYTDDRSLDETMAVGDGDCVLVPRGYHPVGAPHGYDLYYLNVMAGPRRQWKFWNDPDHRWLLER